jgi:hypothetical protein
VLGVGNQAHQSSNASMKCLRPRRDICTRKTTHNNEVEMEKNTAETLADDQLRPDVPRAKHSKPNANALKGSNVRRTRAESEEKQVIISPSCFIK